jgi:7-cyano-7-deazaguanine synthase
MTTKAVVLLSGGQDSTTCLYWAKHRLRADEIHALSLSYGQRHSSELVAAERIARMAGVTSHKFVRVPVLDGAKSALTQSTAIAPDGGLADKAAPNGLPTTFVPGRNLVFLSLAAAYAGMVGAQHVVTGVCQTDYSGYPDCREEFTMAMEEAVKAAFPSSGYPSIVTPLMHLTKAQTVRLAAELPGCLDALGWSVTCYNGQRPGCGTCPACELREKGFAEAGVVDPSTVSDIERGAIGGFSNGKDWAVASQDITLKHFDPLTEGKE